jgi:cellulose synthase/poly-beta-1,6-N-acetylglucosamine synthase-like glycosyltransferase
MICMKTLGEDRFLCSLLLKKGKEIKFINNCNADTELYSDFLAFLLQRRRWVMSTYANNLYLILNVWEIVRNIWNCEDSNEEWIFD